VLATVPTPELAAPVRDALAAVPVHEATMPGHFAAGFEVHEVLGPAALAYADTECFRPAPTPRGWRATSVEPGCPELMAFLGRCPADDADESGLAEATAPVSVVLDGQDSIIATCGWRVWSGATAHLGVLTAPAARGQGAGRVAASAAVDRALAAGLLPQWRARIPASRAVAAALGFVEVGAQLSLRVTART
jgi:GNAT superfamily N-acetyltransferase